MARRLKRSPTALVMIGMGLAQLLGTLQVARSNIDLNDKIMALVGSGYEIVPGNGIEPALRSFSAAFGGGIFFTLTIGIFLSLVTVFWWQVFPLLSIQKRWGRSILGAGVFLALLWCNRHGFNGFGSAYLVMIPFIISLLAGKKEPSIQKKGFIYFIIMFTAPIALLLLMGFIKMDRHAFMSFRDNILLTNRGGQWVNDFYYRYTLYPAEAIKSLEQKQIRTVYFGTTFSSQERTQLLRRFSSLGYLFIDEKHLADLVVVPDTENTMTISVKNRPHAVSLNSFMTALRPILEKISEDSDNQDIFRQMVLWSLILGMPLFVYGILNQSIHFLLVRFFSSEVAAAGTAVVCLIVGAVVLWTLNPAYVKNTFESPNDLLLSTQSKKRLKGLKMVESEGLDISLLPAYEKIKVSRNLTERYWLARILANSRNAATYQDLLIMLNDTSPNVVCMALRSLGLRKNHKAIPSIVGLIKKSDHWYVQWYAYNALKKLSWRPYALN